MQKEVVKPEKEWILTERVSMLMKGMKESLLLMNLGKDVKKERSLLK